MTATPGDKQEEKRFHIFHGEDGYGLRQALSKLKELAGGAGGGGGNVTELEGAQVKASDIINACSAMPFMADRRLVIVSGLLARFQPPRSGGGGPAGGKRRQAGDSEEWKSLAGFVAQMPPFADLVLVEDEVARENTLFKLLAPLADVRPFEPLKGEQLISWMAEEVKSLHGGIAAGAMALLEQLVGGDRWALSNELTKLVTYCGNRAITADDVRQLTVHSREESIFKLVDATLAGRAAEAEQSLARVLIDGVEPLGVVALIHRQLRLTARAKAMGPATPAAELSKKLGLKPGWLTDKTARQAKACSWVRLRLAYRRLVETDLSIKTGTCDGDLALTLFISDLRSSDKAG